MKTSIPVAICLAGFICASFASPPPPSKDIRADFHAAGDCVTSDTAAFQAAADAGGTITIPAPAVCYRITGTVTLKKPAHWIGVGPAAIIKPDLAPTVSTLFAVNTNDFTAESFAINGTGLGTKPVTINHYLFNVGTDGSRYQRLVFQSLVITNWNFSDGNSGLTNLIASHVFFISNAKDVKILQNTARHVEGSCVFAQNSTVLTIQHNTFFGCRWYPINLYAGVKVFDIGWNTIGGDDSIAVFWGGAINLMSQPPLPQTMNGAIHDNNLSGYYGYGSVMHISSANNIVVTANKIANYYVAKVTTDPNTFTAISIETRGVFAANLKMPGGITAAYLGPITLAQSVHLASGATYPVQMGSEWAYALASANSTLSLTQRGIAGSTAAAHPNGTWIANQNGPSSAITVTGNQVYAPTIAVARMQGVYVSNLAQSGTNPVKAVTIINNHFLATGSVAFTNAILVNGGFGGVNGFTLTGNEIVSRTSTDAIVTGAVATTGYSASGMIVGFTASGNTLHDLGDGTNAVQAGFGFQFATLPVLSPNTIDSYHYGVVGFPNALVKLSDVDGQVIQNLGPGGKAYFITPPPGH